ncbi:hypothetical protein [Streptomyces sp. NPDC059224]|uniref:hypothetical protein n=1 Tax=Streptomyces sp. NPDC059224 TaxID=3346775 RepID=UPI00369923B4
MRQVFLYSLYDGIGFPTSTDTLLKDNTVSTPGRNGIVISPPFCPAPTGSATITGNTVAGLGAGATALVDNLAGFLAALSDNHWPPAAPEGPCGGTPAAAPGTVQAEDCDTGGQGMACHVTCVNGNADSYRAEGVDLDNPSDTGGGQTWTAVTTQVTLPAGRQTVTLDQDTGGWNIGHLGFTTGAGSPSPTPTASPGSLPFAGRTANTASAPRPVTVTSSGTASASITGVPVGGDFARTSTCGTTLAATGPAAPPRWPCPVPAPTPPGPTSRRAGPPARPATPTPIPRRT